MVAEIPDLKQLEVFLRIVDEQGIGRAARSLGVSQPHVSQDLKRLEKKLGRRLIERDGRSISLNADGEALVVFARSMFAVAERTRDYFSTPRSRGLIRIGLTEELSRTGLPRVLTLFMATHPGFRLEVESSFDSVALVRGVREARLDIAIGKSFGSAVPGEMLWRAPVAWFGRDDLRGPISDPIPLAVSPSAELRTVLLDRLHAAGRTWTITFQSVSLACLVAAVQAGFGVAPTISTLEVAGVRILDDADLPDLPDATFFIDRRSDIPGVDEFASIVREAVLRLPR